MTGVSPQMGSSKATAVSGWPQRLVLAFGVNEEVLLRKSNIAGFEAYSSEGQRQKWCVPAGAGTPARQVCPHGLVPQLGSSKATAASGWPLRLVLAFGVIEEVLLRKSNIAGFEAGSSEGQRQKWCVPS